MWYNECVWITNNKWRIHFNIAFGFSKLHKKVHKNVLDVCFKTAHLHNRYTISSSAYRQNGESSGGIVTTALSDSNLLNKLHERCGRRAHCNPCRRTTNNGVCLTSAQDGDWIIQTNWFASKSFILHFGVFACEHSNLLNYILTELHLDREEMCTFLENRIVVDIQ